MTRYQILLANAGLTSGAGNNLGTSNLLILAKGRIKAVQLSILPIFDIGSTGEAQTLVQVGKSPVYTAPIPFNGWNPTEVCTGVVGMQNDDTTTQARAITYPLQIMVPCDQAVDAGEQLFVNAADLGGSTQLTNLSGSVVVFVE